MGRRPAAEELGWSGARPEAVQEGGEAFPLAPPNAADPSSVSARSRSIRSAPGSDNGRVGVANRDQAEGASPHCQNQALQLFDLKIQTAFSSITGLHLTGSSWAGLGLCRSWGAEQLVDPAYVAAVVVDPACTQATAALNANLLHPLAPGAALSLKQKALGKPTLLRSEAEPGARAFLAATQNRRPADIFLPSLHGSPAALDLAITAPQRQDVVVQGAAAALAAATAYAASKAACLNTAHLCSQQGVQFVPLVAESTGAWERAASQLLLQIACSAAARTGDDSATLHSDLLQELSVIIRSHRARAAPRRRAELVG
ncbi:Nipped-B-like protein B [Durusdinium trenchii]|uniref:Nipped-B-like protein B n=1 Tax=Durusdinium trenchii TaxID=1381693 RepID=A0ABP0L118_9DINO